MKILQIHNRYIMRGGEDNSVDRIYKALSSKHEVQRCLFSSADWKSPGAPAMWKQLFYLWSNPVSLRTIREAHAKHGADCWLVHNWIPVASAELYAEAGRLGVPIVQYIHNFRPFSVSGYLWAHGKLAPQGLKKNFWPEIFSGSWQGSRLKTAWLAMALLHLHWSGRYRSVQAWIAISEFLKKEFVSAGLDGKRVHALPHSWDLVNPHYEEFPAASNYAYLGRLTPEKGFGVLLETWQRLRSEMGENCPFLIVGGDGPMAGELESHAHHNDRIRPLGYVGGKEKGEVLRSCRAVLAPSLCWEGLGLVAYEAYDYGKPVLAAASGGLTEVVSDEVTGRLHKPGDAGALACQIAELESKPSIGIQWGKNGRNWLEENTRPADWEKKISLIIENTIRSRSENAVA